MEGREVDAELYKQADGQLRASHVRVRNTGMLQDGHAPPQGFGAPSLPYDGSAQQFPPVMPPPQLDQQGAPPGMPPPHWPPQPPGMPPPPGMDGAPPGMPPPPGMPAGMPQPPGM